MHHPLQELKCSPRPLSRAWLRKVLGIMMKKRNGDGEESCTPAEVVKSQRL